MPTYAAGTQKVTIFGTCFNSAEIWTTGFFTGFGGGGGTFSTPTVAAAQAVATAWQTFVTDSASLTGRKWKTEGVKVAAVNADGTTAPGEVAYYYYPTPVAGTTVMDMPPQITLAATLTTAKPRGYGSKGRMFLPGTSSTVGDDGRLTNAQTGALATAFRTFINAVNAAAAVEGNVVVNSAERAGVPGHPALIEPVTGVKIGSVFDTQRRRRNGLVETYASLAL